MRVAHAVFFSVVPFLNIDSISKDIGLLSILVDEVFNFRTTGFPAQSPIVQYPQLSSFHVIVVVVMKDSITFANDGIVFIVIHSFTFLQHPRSTVIDGRVVSDEQVLPFPTIANGE